jgi:LPS-assembly protein
VTLTPVGCMPSIQVASGWVSTLTLYTGGRADCSQALEGKNKTLHGHPAEIEDSRMLIRADDIVYDGETEDMHAEGNVYFYDYAQNEKIWCDKLIYHTEKGREHGVFYKVVGETQPRIITKPGLLTTTTPFHFEGEWAERVETKYILHNGWVTDCTMPKPWWRLRGKKFDIIPKERAKAYDSTFLLAGVPIFFFPYFDRPLKREPRKSGFLIPSPGHNSLRGFYVGAGYFWAINRSYDITYEAQVFDSGLVSNHAEFRGKPKPGTDFDLVLFGSATSQTNSPSGLTAYGVGRSDLGNGWTAGGTLNYITTLRFQQDWSQSYNETVGSEITSSGFINKNWDTYTFDVVVSRSQLFANVEQEITNPTTGKTSLGPLLDTDIRKLPEFLLTSRDHDLFAGLPLWYSFDVSAGLMSRSEPIINSSYQVTDEFKTSPFVDRIRLAPHLTTAFSLGPLHFVPSIGIDETFYSEAQIPYLNYYHAVGTNIVRSAGDFSFTAILPSLERIYDHKTFLGDKLKHVFEPRATYNYVTGVGPEFNQIVRFDGTDILANTSEVDLYLANRIYAKRKEQVLEIFSWELEQKRYFNETFGGALISGQSNIFTNTLDLTGYAFLVGPRSTSPVVSTLRLTPISGLSIQWQADYDHRVHAIVNSAFSVEYTWKKFYHLSGGNNEVHSNPLLTPYANQFRTRAWVGDTNHRGWNAGLDAIYDYRQQKLLWATAQVTYNTDCCGLSLQFRRVYRVGLPDENLYAVSFSIANMGSFGTLKKQDRLF